jgi:tRNA pseudouridine55 synthase
VFGILNLNKPAGVTSRDVVNRVQRVVRPHKVGHAGTLDPLATGVLVVGVGPATRLVEYVQRMPKQYLATFLLGRESDTEDVEGTVRELAAPPIPSREAIAAALPRFLGRIAQRPPAFSALKVDGQRAYKKARAGDAVALAPREIDVYSIDLVSYDYPRWVLDIACGSGTYVRSLGRDMAESLGTAAVMEKLERTAIGDFHVRDAIDPAVLTADNIITCLQSPSLAVAALPAVVLSSAEANSIAQGRTIVRNNIDYLASEFAAYDEQQRLLAILVRRSGDEIGPRLNFCAGTSG